VTTDSSNQIDPVEGLSQIIDECFEDMQDLGKIIDDLRGAIVTTINSGKVDEFYLQSALDRAALAMFAIYQREADRL